MLLRNKLRQFGYNIIGVSPARTPQELKKTIKKFIPEAKITFKLDPELAQFFDVFYGGMKAVDDSWAREEWGWEPLHTNFEKIVEDFIYEIRTRPQLYGLPIKN